MGCLNKVFLISNCFNTAKNTGEIFCRFLLWYYQLCSIHYSSHVLSKKIRSFSVPIPLTIRMCETRLKICLRSMEIPQSIYQRPCITNFIKNRPFFDLNKVSGAEMGTEGFFPLFGRRVWAEVNFTKYSNRPLVNLANKKFT